MRARLAFVAVALLSPAVAACGGEANRAGADLSSADAVAELEPVGLLPGASATLTSVADGTRVVLRAEGAEGYGADIHAGTCTDIDFSGFEAFLHSIVDGRLETRIAVDTAVLLATPHAVHLHSPTGEPAACGEIEAG